MTSLRTEFTPEAWRIHTTYPIDIFLITSDKQAENFIKKYGDQGEEFVFDGDPCTFDLGDKIVIMMERFDCAEYAIGKQQLAEYMSDIAHESNHAKQLIYKTIREGMLASTDSEVDCYLLGSITEALASILL